MTINEKDLAALSYPEAPKMVTPIPGPKAQALVKEAWDNESMTRGAGGAPIVFAEGKGSTVKDPDGNILVDMAAGVGVTAVGRCHPRIIQAVKEQSEVLMHSADLSSVVRTDLARKISSVAAGDLKGNCITYFTQSGSGAVETALKFTRKITGRSQIVAFQGAYHGVWGLSGSLTTGPQYRHGFIQPQPTIHIPYPYCYRCAFGKEYPSCDMECAKYADMVLNTPYTGAHDVGAVIIEPQQGEGGYIVPPKEYMPMLKKSCEKNGCLFIADEVQSGAGRSGKMWAIEHSDVTPDMHTYGKGLGGDLPSAGLVMRRDLALKVDEYSQPNTFAANGLVAAATMTNIDILSENDYELVKRGARLGDQMKGELSEFMKKSKSIGEVRGRGLYIGIEMVDDKKTKAPISGDKFGAILGAYTQKGYIVVPCGKFSNCIRLMPPLVITEEQAMTATSALIDCISSVEKQFNM